MEPSERQLAHAHTAMTRALHIVNPAGLYDPSANGYSHVAVAEPPARIVFLAGQGGEDALGVLSSDFAGQVRQALANLGTALAAAGAHFADVAKLTVLVVDHDANKHAVLAAELVQAWSGAVLPACTLVPVPRLALDGMLFEIDATAVLREGALR
jgi:enamine deaminase RidA (YjgF/YER057c/UK114 family)